MYLAFASLGSTLPLNHWPIIDWDNPVSCDIRFPSKDRLWCSSSSGVHFCSRHLFRHGTDLNEWNQAHSACSSFARSILRPYKFHGLVWPTGIALVFRSALGSTETWASLFSKRERCKDNFFVMDLNLNYCYFSPLFWRYLYHAFPLCCIHSLYALTLYRMCLTIHSLQANDSYRPYFADWVLFRSVNGNNTSTSPLHLKGCRPWTLNERNIWVATVFCPYYRLFEFRFVKNSVKYTESRIRSDVFFIDK